MKFLTCFRIFFSVEDGMILIPPTFNFSCRWDSYPSTSHVETSRSGIAEQLQYTYKCTWSWKSWKGHETRECNEKVMLFRPLTIIQFICPRIAWTFSKFLKQNDLLCFSSSQKFTKNDDIQNDEKEEYRYSFINFIQDHHLRGLGWLNSGQKHSVWVIRRVNLKICRRKDLNMKVYEMIKSANEYSRVGAAAQTCFTWIKGRLWRRHAICSIFNTVLTKSLQEQNAI